MGVVLAAALALTGCADSAPPVIPTAQPSTAPVFATSADALAAAKKAYVGYLGASDLVAHEGGDRVDPLRAWDSPRQFTNDERDFDLMRSQGHHTVGESTYSYFSLESFDMNAGRAEVIAYVCLRIDATQLLDRSGADVGASRQLAIPLQVSFVSSEAGSQKLIVDRSVVWSGTDFCSQG
jgi:hypothetical protein